MSKIYLFIIIVIAFVLRFFLLGSNPPSLSWDEASLGYNAYTIFTSGKDEHGQFMPLDRFIAFGDDKPPGYIYATVPAIAFFGLNEFSVRLPSMLAGLMIVLITYLLVNELFKNNKISLLASLFVAISPWLIHFSRAAYESNLATLFNEMGIYFFILSRRTKWSLLLSVAIFVFSFYTFNANRIIAPLLLLALSILYIKDIKKNIKWIIVSIIVGFLLILPSVNYLRSRESRVRFQEVSIFNNLDSVVLSNDRIARDGNTWWANIIHNRRIIFFLDFLKHYSDNFGGRFLFTHGDVNPRLSIQEMGELYVWDLPFIIIGLYLIIKNKEKAIFSILVWMIITPIPAGTAKETPHALRILSILPTYQILIAYGLYRFVKFLNQLSYQRFSLIILSIIILTLSANIYYYLHINFVHYPLNWSGQWQYGYKELVNYIENNQNQYDSIYVTPALGRPYIYFAFYEKYALDQFLIDKTESRDWFGFRTVSKLGKVAFDIPSQFPSSGNILVASSGDIPSGFTSLKSIKNLEGNTVFQLSERK